MTGGLWRAVPAPGPRRQHASEGICLVQKKPRFPPCPRRQIPSRCKDALCEDGIGGRLIVILEPWLEGRPHPDGRRRLQLSLCQLLASPRGLAGPAHRASELQSGIRRARLPPGPAPASSPSSQAPCLRGEIHGMKCHAPGSVPTAASPHPGELGGGASGRNGGSSAVSVQKGLRGCHLGGRGGKLKPFVLKHLFHFLVQTPACLQAVLSFHSRAHLHVASYNACVEGV